MITILFFFAGDLSSAAEPKPLSQADVDEIKCLVQLDREACHSAYYRSPESHDGMEFARAGCNELRSPESCVHLADWYRGHDKFDQAMPLYSAACEQKITQACERLVAQKRLDAENLHGPELSSAVTSITPLVDKICAGENASSTGCTSATGALAEVKRGLDATFGRCELRYQNFKAGGAAESEDSTGMGDGLTHLLTQDACLSQCKLAFSQFRLAAELPVFRGRCFHGGKSIDSPWWRTLASTEKCPSLGRVIGEEDAQLYAKCHCERQMFTSANKLAEPYGVYLRAEIAYAKKVGSEQWFRCGAGLYFDDPKEAAADKSVCKKNVQALKKALRSDAELATYVLNFKPLICGGN